MSERARGTTPLEITRRTDEDGAEFVRFEVTIHPPLDSGGEDLPHERHLFDNPDPHIHPEQDETFKVLSGRYGVETDGDEHVLEEGERITVPGGTTHRQWNPTDEPIRVVHKHRPPRESETIYETLYALAQAGKTDEKGLPNRLQLAVVLDEYPGHVYRPTPPVPVQKALFLALGVAGRLAGYEATHTREEVGEG